MVVPDGDWEAVGRDSHAVIDEAKAAGVYVFGGGIDEAVPPALVSADGAVAEGGYPWAPSLDGGFTVLELPSRKEAVAWAARIAKACRCDQELRVFQFDPTVLKAARPRAQRWLPSSRLSFRSVAADDKPGSRPSPMNFHGRSEALTKVGLS